jgi:hypothetical protein
MSKQNAESLQVVYSHNLKQNDSLPVEKLAQLFPGKTFRYRILCPEPSYLNKLTYDIDKQLHPNQAAEVQKFLNKDELRKYQFFSSKLISRLKQNGFVVTDRVYKGGYSVLSFGEALYSIYTEDKNLFVSTDMVTNSTFFSHFFLRFSKHGIKVSTMF